MILLFKNHIHIQNETKINSNNQLPFNKELLLQLHIESNFRLIILLNFLAPIIFKCV